MQPTLHENHQILSQIEWGSIHNLLKDECHFDINLEKLTRFHHNKKEIEDTYKKTQLFTNSLYENEFRNFINAIYGLKSDLDIFSYLIQIQKEQALSLDLLNQIAIGCEIYFDNKKLIEKFLPEYNYLEDFQNFKRLFQKNFLNLFRKIVNSNGEVKLENHPEIGPLYQKRLDLELKIRESLNHSLNSSQLQDKIQFNSFDVINDRYVIPIKTNAFSSNLGQIISRSDTGHTLYVEPTNIARMNIERIDLIIRIQALISKLERDLTLSLFKFVPEIRHIFNLCYECDEFSARSNFSKKLNLSMPIFFDKKKIKLKNAFHPLIENPVKNDIQIDPTDYGLIISGPNTGGKTATLKTLALTQLFIRYGLFIPCDYGDIFLYDKVFYFGNDQQDLTNGLSSFSAEVKNYTELLESVGNTNLILIDEIFNSTSSEEASALAIAFFKELHERSDTHIIVSSHHQTLKTILHQDNNYISAHVGFNTEINTPTYKLHYGSPGSSHALRIFHSLADEKPYLERIYQNSLQYLDNQVIHYEKLLESLAEKEHQLSKTLQENKELGDQLKNQKKSMEGVIKLKIDEQVRQAEQKLSKIVSKGENILAQVKAGKISKLKAFDNKIADIKSEIPKNLPKEKQKDYSNLSVPTSFQEGKDYFCLKLEKTIKITKIDHSKKLAHIGKGNFSMKVPLSSLRVANAKNNHFNSQGSSVIKSSRSSKVEYDCRGMRLEEFESLINDIISDLILGDIPYLNIIHGHGTGVLKNWLRKFIKENKDLTILPNDTGNDGETRIGLK